MLTIDLNVDVGEGMNNESEIMPYISSCNIACGGHAGDKKEMEKIVLLSKIHQVNIGAHPSFPDKENFGRKVIMMQRGNLLTSIMEQVGALHTIAENFGQKLIHIKAHGALYHLANEDKQIAEILVYVAKKFSIDRIFGLEGSTLSSIVKASGLTFIREGFGDRAYLSNGKLVSRSHANAVLSSQVAINQQVLGMVTKQEVVSIDNIRVAKKTDTICFHGDHEDASEKIKKVVQYLHKSGVSVSPLK